MAAPTRDIYLAEGFQPTSLRIPQLRSILHEHGVRHSSAAKKADLVALFVNNIQPRAAAILAQDARVKPSSTGIVVVSSTGQESQERLVEPPVPVVGKRPRGRPRKTATLASEELKPEGDSSASELPIAKRPRSRRSTVDVTSDVEEPTPAPPKKRGPGRPPKTPKKLNDLKSKEFVDSDADSRMEGIQELPAIAPTPKAVRRKSSKPALPEPTPARHQQPIVEINRHAAAVPSSSRRTSFKPPPIKAEESSTPPRRRLSNDAEEGGSSPFSDYNPFQAGSAEAAEVVRRRRKSSLGLADGKRRAPRPSEWTATSQPSASILRKVGPSTENLRSPAPPVPRVAYADEVAEYDAHNAVVERKFGEVTSSQDEEPQVVVTTSTQVVDRPQRKAIMRPKPKAPRSTVPLSLFSLLIFIVVAHYKSLSAVNGFCDNNTNTNSVILGRELPIQAAQECIAQRTQFQVENPDETPALQCDLQALPLVPFLPRPTRCTPCPQNAQCTAGEVVACDSEYMLKPSLLAPLSPLFDGWPTFPTRVFPPSCKPDTTRMRQIGQLATGVERYLAKRRGLIECANEPKGKVVVPPGLRYGVSETELSNTFAELRVDSIDRADFDEMFSRAITDLVAHKELIESIDENGVSHFTAARSEMSLACQAKLEAVHLLDQWKSQLGGTAAVLVGIYALANRIEAARKEQKQVRGYTDTVIRRLQDQEYRHFTDPVQTPLPYMPPAQLRDVILPASMNAATRTRIWTKVEAKTEENANVLVREREVKGDVWKTWEWSALGGRTVEDKPGKAGLAIESGRPAF